MAVVNAVLSAILAGRDAGKVSRWRRSGTERYRSHRAIASPCEYSRDLITTTHGSHLFVTMATQQGQGGQWRDAKNL